MQKNEITIAVIGQAGTGKSQIMYTIMKMLRKEGFDVQIKGSTDLPTESDLVKYAQGIPAGSIKTKTKLILVEQQAIRNPF